MQLNRDLSYNKTFSTALNNDHFTYSRLLILQKLICLTPSFMAILNVKTDDAMQGYSDGHTIHNHMPIT